MEISSIQFLGAATILHRGTALGRRIVPKSHDGVEHLELENATVTILMNDGTAYLVPASQVACEVSRDVGSQAIANTQKSTREKQKHKRAQVADVGTTGASHTSDACQIV